MNQKNKMLVSALAVMCVAGCLAPEAGAVSQFARRTGLTCSACHTAFPRLTAFGEKFKYNGFQTPGNQDGDEVATNKLNSSLALIKDVGNWFGARISVSPFNIKTNDLSKNGNKDNRTTLGQANWLQFFTAGPIYKNVSIFIETEFASTALKNNWMYIGWHNILGQEGQLNARTGTLPMLDWHAVSGRLRSDPAINDQYLAGINSSAGASSPEDQVGIHSANPGMEIFGYTGPIFYSAVVQNGKSTASDPNQYKNVGGTLGYKIQSGSFQGSQFDLFAMQGVDTKNTSTSQLKNVFIRLSPGFVVRRGALDIHAAYLYAKDNNWKLAASPDKIIVNGITAKVGYNINPRWYAHIQYDNVWSHDVNDIAPASSQDFHKISPSLWLFPRENVRVGLTARIDMKSTANPVIHKYKNHELFSTIRAMF